MRMRLEIGEPFELVAEAPEGVTIVGELLEEESSEQELILRPIEGSLLGGKVIDRVDFSPRHVGDSLADLEAGEPIIVHGEARVAGTSETLWFIGAAYVET